MPTNWRGKVIHSNEVRVQAGGKVIVRPPFLDDHFVYGAGAFNSHVPQNWTTTETGAGAGKASFVPTATGATEAVGVAGTTTNNGEEIGGTAVVWDCTTHGKFGPLVFEARVKVVGTTTPADGDFVLGLANALTFTNSLPYVVGASSLYTTSVPVEFAGFHYSSIPTSGTLFNAAGNNFVGIITEKSTVPGTAISSAVVKDSLYHIYRVELDLLGNAGFFIDDNPVGEVALAVTAATALTPYFNVVAKNSHNNTMTVDFAGVYSSAL
jgi:hypothetical protein